ncbi:MAG: hypothetical protein HYV65_02760 [Candidatus Spechtbacteria bacterium]|nr:hypothetical protein [Candidatus Spechtbacteria bacterium]
MRQSHLFTKTTKENPRDEASVNAQLLERAGFIYKNSAGVYSYLPLGWRVISKINSIIREEMNAIGGQEILMPALVERRYLDATGRFDVEVGFEARGKKDDKASFILGWTHEEVLTEIASRFINSYKDLPFAAYQIQTKFRNEPRAKSGVLRGREFMMKDLYSFHSSEEDLFRYYEEVKGAYMKTFKRCGLDAVYTVASGGDFTISNTHEFQVICPVGEDTIYICSSCNYAENSEISHLNISVACPKCGGTVEEKKAIEVGNIFPLGTKYSKAFNLMFVNEKGDRDLVVMGSYGIGVGRTMGAVVEVSHDDKGIIWPGNIAPYQVNLLRLSDDEETERKATELYEILEKQGIEVLYDDRLEMTAGEKFADADLVGIPMRAVVSKKSLESGGAEIKPRKEEGRGSIFSFETIGNYVRQTLG